jgi:hypothetical protein
MKRDDRGRHLDEILDRLEELDELDLRIIRPRSGQPVEIPVEELFSYGERDEERQRLYKELRAAQTIED